jgi:protein-S-isoprenylcysteine O-methyltransferase Ste14
MLKMAPHSDSANPERLRNTQRVRKYMLRFGFALCICFLITTDSTWRTQSPGAYELVSRLGTMLILVCVMGRTWCTLYIGGLKKRQLVTLGPYSVVRNPLYLFTIIGTAGIGAQAGSLIMALLLALLVGAVFYAVALREEAFLIATFGSEYAAYAHRVPLFLPRISAWQDAKQLTVSPYLVRRTFTDASLFLFAIPVNDLIDWLQDGGWLPVFLRLP